MSDAIQPLRLPAETALSFDAFVRYLRLGPDRNHAEVARQLGKGSAVIERWSSAFAWVERAAARDEELARIALRAEEMAVAAVSVDWAQKQAQQRLEEWELRCEALALAREAIQRWREKPERCESLESIGRMMEIMSRMGRLASGLETGSEVQGVNVGVSINLEHMAALERAYGKPLPGEVVEVQIEGAPKGAGAATARGDAKALVVSPAGAVEPGAT